MTNASTFLKTTNTLLERRRHVTGNAVIVKAVTCASIRMLQGVGVGSDPRHNVKLAPHWTQYLSFRKSHQLDSQIRFLPSLSLIKNIHSAIPQIGLRLYRTEWFRFFSFPDGACSRPLHDLIFTLKPGQLDSSGSAGVYKKSTHRANGFWIYYNSALTRFLAFSSQKEWIIDYTSLLSAENIVNFVGLYSNKGSDPTTG